MKKLFVVLIVLLALSHVEFPTHTPTPLWRVRTYGKVVWSVVGETSVATTILRDMWELEVHVYSVQGKLLAKWDVNMWFQLVYITDQTLVGYIWDLSSMKVLTYSHKGRLLSQILVEMDHRPSRICITPSAWFVVPYRPDTLWTDGGLIFFNPKGNQVNEYHLEYNEEITDLFYQQGHYFCETNIHKYIFTPNGKLVSDLRVDLPKTSPYLLVEDKTFLLYFNN